MATQAATGGHANLARIRAEVARALEQFLARQRGTLGGMGEDLLPCLDAMEGLLAGGKRLRPAFCYWGWRAAGGPDCPEIFTAASALELLQASALVHDDVMDASETRRGKPAVHRQFASRFAAGKLGPTGRFRSAGGPEPVGRTGSWVRTGSAEQFGLGAAILIGDMLLAWTDELYHGSGFPPEVLASAQHALNAMRTEVAAGQYLDLLSQISHTTSVRAALRVVTYKTAKYTIERPLHLGVALAVGAQATSTASKTVPGGRPAQARAAIAATNQAARTATAIEAVCTDYGIPLGIAFQLRDDVLGVFGDPARTGKPVHGDISEGKQTVLMAIARERATKSQARVLDRNVGDRHLTEAAAARVKAVLTETGAVAECETLIAASVKEAISALDGAPITADAKAALATLAVAATDREE